MTATELALQARLDRLERRLRWLVGSLLALLSVGVLGVVFAVTQQARAASAERPGPKVLDVLRVRELDIVDPHGIARVKLAAPLPDPFYGGRKHSRGPGGTISGVLLYDADGNERSGYATVDTGYSNVMFTLDDPSKQHVLFLTEPTGGTTLRLFNKDTNDRADIAVSDDGPSITLVRHGREIYRQPSGPLAQPDGQH